MKYAIYNRWTGAVQFMAEIDCAEAASFGLKIGLAVQWAMKTGTNLTGANLTGADLTRADLTGTNLIGANLTGADLTRADLTDADLTYANLTRANLTRADLTYANLTGTNLTGADLTGADLTGANLTRANLTRANLTGADLTALRPIRNDLFDILLRSRAETPALLATLRAGRINGAVYEGPCACLCGTIAKARGVSVPKLGFADASRPAERWFLPLREGQTPSNNQIARITEGWIVEFMALAGVAEATSVVAP